MRLTIITLVFFFGFLAQANMKDAVEAFKSVYSQTRSVSEPTAYLVGKVCEIEDCTEKYFMTQTIEPVGEGSGPLHGALVKVSKAEIKVTPLMKDFAFEIIKASIDNTVPVKKISVPTKAGGTLLIELNRPVEAFKLAYDQTDAVSEPVALIENSSCGFSCSNNFFVIQQFKNSRKVALLLSDSVGGFYIRSLKADFLDNLDDFADPAIAPRVLKR